VTTSTKHPRLVSLIRGHRVRIARALARQVRTLSIRYKRVEVEALEKSFFGLLLAIEDFLATGSDQNLIDRTKHTANLRAQLGFQLEDLAMAGMCFMPVLRRFLMDHSKTMDEAMADFDSFEAVAIPLLSRMMSLFRTSTDITSPGDNTLFTIQNVEGDDDDELTAYNTPFSGFFPR
jgi:hypothetical protein